jgi:predicted flap endonuclease-1-like 5' DNA nuclease
LALPKEDAMTYTIEQIEGIGTHFSRQLKESGVHTSQDLLDHCGTVDKLRQLELATGISAKQLTEWKHQADLMRISGIGPEFGQLLERSGVESVQQLAMRDAENITHLVARVNAEKHLTRTLPPLKTVTGWINRARMLMERTKPKAPMQPASVAGGA